MDIAIVTDAWLPQVNGVVTTLRRTQAELTRLGHSVTMITPDGHRTVPCPTYPEIRLALWPGRRVAATLDALRPDAIHVATEGPLGLAAAHYCRRRGIAFTTSYHTRFPQYLRQRAPVPLRWSYAFLRRHHGHAKRTLVATEHQRRDLVDHGFRNVVIWSRGVDADVFRPYDRAHLDLPRPIFAYVGRVAIEKNLDAFLSLDLPGTQVVIGDGPDRRMLERRYVNAHFLGYRHGEELARCVSAADVFVFPSRTDTFGLVMIEAMACGTPVAAYPVTGPVDVVTPGVDGVLDTDLGAAALAALALDRNACRTSALRRTWSRATGEFLGHLVAAHDGSDLVLERPSAEDARTAR
jgi:glycosyltransferase involved in cell wall biosynthesis